VLLHKSEERDLRGLPLTQESTSLQRGPTSHGGGSGTTRFEKASGGLRQSRLSVSGEV